ncbi:heme o synthase [Polymorphum gilvum]|uniref:Protoheme IX farnesyltransferase n=1 Tax=Polymorphum gilvum (strain LMG 25793 / CGMCC 1.9160 / SL003B-26A1) TaxID=991905 RepID=F2IZ95_POLGS|nr:heme o synthase [Polymorphum gilvum]ADZ71818.1 Protoheme IX farnesyltransferase 2 [Polymorphum gilvum SL003B-26A1]
MSLVERHNTIAGESAAWDGGMGSVGDYVALLKPRVMSLVIFTAFVGMMLAPGVLHPVLAAVALLCIAIGAGASGALNMWYDADIDRVMSRTAKRPIPAGKISRQECFAFGMTLSIGSVVTLGLLVNWFAGAFLAFTIFFYVVVYTMWLKRSTPQNIVIGGAAGAFPPMIGWAAVTGDVSLESLVLFLIIFMWTPPHFWALALFKSGDYRAAGIPMLPVVAGEDATRNQILAYSLILTPIAVSPYLLGFAGPLYGIASTVLGAVFFALALRVWRRRSGDEARKAAVRLFSFSILYLFLLFALLLAESVIARTL